MDCVLKYVDNKKIDKECIALINQVWIFKRMILPCDLIGLHENQITKEAREREEKSCVLQNMDLESVPKPSKKSFEMWDEFL